MFLLFPPITSRGLGTDFSPHPIHLQLTGCITASAFYHGFAKEKGRRRFLISNVSAGKAISCRGQCIARELRVYWARHMRIGVHEKEAEYMNAALCTWWQQ